MALVTWLKIIFFLLKPIYCLLSNFFLIDEELSLMRPCLTLRIFRLWTNVLSWTVLWPGLQAGWRSVNLQIE